jgi:hypothetical protein
MSANPQWDQWDKEFGFTTTETGNGGQQQQQEGDFFVLTTLSWWSIFGYWALWIVIYTLIVLSCGFWCKCFGRCCCCCCRRSYEKKMNDIPIRIEKEPLIEEEIVDDEPPPPKKVEIKGRKTKRMEIKSRYL